MMLGMQPALAPVSVFFLRKTWFLLLVVLMAVSSAAQQPPKTSAAPKKKSRLAIAIDQTIEKGHDSSLPPHISDLLGISPERKEVPVKQAVRMGEPIRGFEVSTQNHNDVVLFVDSRAQKESTFYLTSRTGILRRVLSIREGVGHPRRPSKEDQAAFQKEKQQWVDELVPKSK